MEILEKRFNVLKTDFPDDPSVEGFTFRLVDGAFSVTEHWRGMDEIYADGLCVYVPPRIWALALPWINSNSATKRPSSPR